MAASGKRSMFCQGNGLTEDDTHLVLGGWRGLYERIFGANLVGCPHFEGIDHIDTDRIKSALDDDPYPPFEPTHRIYKERLFTLGETEEEPAARSYWALEGGGLVFHRGGSHRLVRQAVFGKRDTLPWLPGTRGLEVEKHRVNYPGGGVRIGGVDCTEGSSSMVLCSYGESYSTLQQSIGVKSFGSPFLDSCPLIEVSAWCSALETGEGRETTGNQHMAGGDTSNNGDALKGDNVVLQRAGGSDGRARSPHPFNSTPVANTLPCPSHYPIPPTLLSLPCITPTPLLSSPLPPLLHPCFTSVLMHPR
ncbi:unnamed protein product [Closterium sp. NIES-64]|nr:unnamed protein product [Closterium sp. NIES-64]CAI5999734.1 unnamed protein product [Closterium sp. NIES-64]